MTSDRSHSRAIWASRRQLLIRSLAAAATGLGGVVLAGCGRSLPAGGEPAVEERAPSAMLSPAPASSLAELAGLEPLAAGLLRPDVLGVPADWAIRDFDFTLADDADEFADSDPFLGLLECPDGTIREGSERVWLARRYTAPEVPLENGLLSIEIIVEVESPEQWDDDRRALRDCATVEHAELTVASTQLETPVATAPSTAGEENVELAAATLELLASPTADVPFPSAFNATTINVDQITVTVIIGGIDVGESWQRLADDIAVTAIRGLHSVRPPS